jgi:outer membrane murein-binding lipoprotein Lpp
MSVKSVSLTEVAVGDVPTHIVIYREGSNAKAKADSVDLQKKIDDLMTQVERLSKRILHLELDAENRALEVKTTPFFGSSIVPEPTGMHVRRLSDVCDDSKTTLKAIVNGLTPPPNATKIVTIASHVEEVHQEEAEEEVEEEAEAEEAEEAEAEGEELTEFEYKGTTYWRDSENLVYSVDGDGDLDDTPIGVWSEEKKKVLKYKQ